MRPGDPTPVQQSARRSGRITRRIAILLFGYDEEGHTFSERTHTVVLSRHGAGILSTHRFTPEQELILRVEETNREAEVRVVGEIATDGNLHTYGVAFLNKNLDFWQTDFPQQAVSDVRPSALPLECGACGARIEVAHGEFEYDIGQIHGGLTRHCPQCGTLTVWRRADRKGPAFADDAVPVGKPAQPHLVHEGGTLVQERRFAGSESRSSGSRRSSRSGDPFLRQGKQSMDAPKPGWWGKDSTEGKIASAADDAPRAGLNFSGLAQEEGMEVAGRIVEPAIEEDPITAATPEPDAAHDPAVERRRRARAKVNFFACVKTLQFGLDVVTCLDMSKGGVGFRSRNQYKQEMRIQIAVPYSPEVKDAPAIFVSGRIANVREMDDMWRYGVEFLKSA
jgi:hypothetical protein